MDRVILVVAVVIVAACGQEPVEVPEARQAKEFLFVDVPEAQIRERPAEDAPVVATYKLGDRVPVLGDRDGWSEIRIGYDESGWAKREELAAEKATFESAGQAKARFVDPPNPVFSPGGAKGQIYIEASVNSQGVVTEVKLVGNTTGSEALAQQNLQAIRKARFYPMIINGRARPFIYDHVVTY